jgi:hypothetical protein
LRIEPHHRDFRVQVAADELEDPFQNGRVEEKRWPKIEAETVVLDRGTPTADSRQPLDDVNLKAGMGQQERRRETARPGTDNDDLVRSMAALRARRNSGDSRWRTRNHAVIQ